MASAKHGTGLVRATWARKDDTPPDCERALCKRCGTDRSLGKRGLNEKENWRKEEQEQSWCKERDEGNQLIRLETRNRDSDALLFSPHYIIDYERPSHSSSSSSRFLFPPFSCVGCSRCSTSPARVTQVNRLPFVSYVTTGDISGMSLASVGVGRGRSDKS